MVRIGKSIRHIRVNTHKLWEVGCNGCQIKRRDPDFFRVDIDTYSDRVLLIDNSQRGPGEEGNLYHYITGGRVRAASLGFLATRRTYMYK